VLCGGVGAARFLRGLVEVVDPASVTAIVNVADDTELHGLHVSPDIDTVTYTLADAIDADRGWGLAGESWQAMAMFERYGNPTWFSLGDRDLATHIVRTERLRAGEPLSQVSALLAQRWGLATRVLPVTDDPVRTMVTVDLDHGPEELGFQEYFVGHQHAVPVRSVRFDGVESAAALPAALDAIDGATTVVIAPSNPIVSIGPLLAVPGVRDALAVRRDRTVAVSPIVAGAALKGPADRMLRELGHEASVVGIARLYAPLARTLVVDRADAASAPAVEAEGIGCVVTDTIMRDVDRAAALATEVLAAA
jgi:LPPG:FO 2-phospho-L-lactate transferase